jgi:hypothetical protein
VSMIQAADVGAYPTSIGALCAKPSSRSRARPLLLIDT